MNDCGNCNCSSEAIRAAAGGCPRQPPRMTPEEADPPRGKRKWSDIIVVLFFETWPLLGIGAIAAWAVFA